MKIQEQIILKIPVNKAEKFWEIIKENGYPETAEGIFDFIMNEIPEENRTRNFLDTILEFKNSHPKEYEVLRKKSAGVASAFIRKWAFKF